MSYTHVETHLEMTEKASNAFQVGEEVTHRFELSNSYRHGRALPCMAV